VHFLGDVLFAALVFDDPDFAEAALSDGFYFFVRVAVNAGFGNVWRDEFAIFRLFRMDTFNPIMRGPLYHQLLEFLKVLRLIKIVEIIMPVKQLFPTRHKLKFRYILLLAKLLKQTVNELFVFLI